MNIRENDFGEMRRRMVVDQLSGRDIKDKLVLDIFEKVPRHKFTDPKFYKEMCWKKKSVDAHLFH